MYNMTLNYLGDLTLCYKIHIILSMIDAKYSINVRGNLNLELIPKTPKEKQAVKLLMAFINAKKKPDLKIKISVEPGEKIKAAISGKEKKDGPK